MNWRGNKIEVYIFEGDTYLWHRFSDSSVFVAGDLEDPPLLQCPLNWTVA